MTCEVTGCKGCPFYFKHPTFDYQYCSYPQKHQSCTNSVNMFATCPLKTEAITIKFTAKKENDGTE